MTTYKKTPENEAKVTALKAVKETQWVGELTFETIGHCLASMCLNTFNSGWYVPTPFKIAGVHGYFMANEDGSLYYEQRIIKVSENEYRIENLSNSGFATFEEKYLELI